MDQIKIGKFIAIKRKEMGLTQSALAEKLNITDRAVSKWERGKSLPDASIMLNLCEILGIKANELLLGEMIDQKENNQKHDEVIKELLEQKQRADKHLLNLEIVVGAICLFVLLSATIVVGVTNIEEALKVIILLVSLIPLLVATPFMLAIEQKAGYYQCEHCKHKYIPSFKSVFLAMHVGRTRYMNCPKCGKKSWQKKVIDKN